MPLLATQLHLPCAESWAAMTPTGPGRHCAACQRVVVDFTQKTDAELLAYLRQAGRGGTCGRFRADQLHRPLQPAPSPNRWRGWLASVLALGGVLGSSRAAAQTERSYFSGGPTPVATSPTTPAAAPAPAAAKAPPPAEPASAAPRVVRGRVVSQHDTLGLPGVMVQLQGTNLGTSTTATGEFELTLPANAAGDTLLFSSVGYGRQQRVLPAASQAQLVVALAEDVQGMLGDVVVAGGYALRKPWPWHPRRLYYWSKYQLLRPFRQ